ncbi:hypothetical protein C8R46DRAFT_1029905 [Mycena filopes]|nr:hypothetical protein C8R46DRAFT_1029905 [Mycena filopes]
MARTSARTVGGRRAAYRTPAQRVAAHVANGQNALALRVIANRPVSERRALHLAAGDLYARDQPEQVGGHRPKGYLYCTGVLDKKSAARFGAGTLSHAEFLQNLRFKLGVAKKFYRRRTDYRKCDSKGQRHFWFFRIQTRHRYLIEALMRLGFRRFADPDIQECSGCHKNHQEYFPLSSVGPFSRILARLLANLAAIGEPNPRILRCRDYHLIV